MTPEQRERLRIVRIVSASVYVPLTILAIGLVESQPLWALILLGISFPFALVLYLALSRETMAGSLSSRTATERKNN